MQGLGREELRKAHYEKWDEELEGTSIEGLVETMNNCASLLADYLIAREAAEQEDTPLRGFLHGGDDSWFDYIPNGLDVVSNVIKIWHRQLDAAEMFHPEVGEGETVFFQDCTPEEAIESLTAVLKKSGFTIYAEEE